MNGTAIKCSGVTISISKNVAKDRFFNSNTIACAVSQNRKVSVTLHGYPWGLHSALFTAGQSTSVPVVVTFTFGAYILKLTMPRVRQQQKAPSASVPTEIENDFTGHALASATLNDEIVATLSLTA